MQKKTSMNLKTQQQKLSKTKHRNKKFKHEQTTTRAASVSHSKRPWGPKVWGREQHGQTEWPRISQIWWKSSSAWPKEEQQTLRINIKKTTPRHVRTKLLKASDREENLKLSWSQKVHITHRGKRKGSRLLVSNYTSHGIRRDRYL